MPYENKLLLTPAHLISVSKSFTQQDLLAEIKASVDLVGREIKELILFSRRSQLYWSPDGPGPGIASLIEQMIDQRHYYFPFIKKVLDQIEPGDNIIHRHFHQGWWGKYIYRLMMNNKSWWMAKCRSKTMAFHYVQALLPILSDTQNEWMEHLYKCQYISIGQVSVRIPAISFFPLKLGDMLCILSLKEQLLLSEITSIQAMTGFPQ